jgi:multiple sugar transport system permease protein
MVGTPAVVAPSRPQMHAPQARASRLERQETVAAYGFILPAYVLYILFALLPTLATLAFSVTSIDRFTWTFEFVGLDNLRFVLLDRRFWASFTNTFVFVAMAVTGNVGMGLILAALLDRTLPAPVLYLLRLAYFLPVLMSTALVSLVWQFIYSTDLGVLNYYLQAVGLPKIGWLTDRNVAMTSVVIMDVWKHFGFFMVILLAAMQSIPRSIVEAAWLDGAGPLQVFFYVKVPMIAPVILFCVTYATITGLQMFETVRILTSGGPGDATISLVMYMYEQTFSAQDIGAGTSAALILLIAIMIVTYIQIRLGRRVAH